MQYSRNVSCVNNDENTSDTNIVIMHLVSKNLYSLCLIPNVIVNLVYVSEVHIDLFTVNNTKSVL